MRIAVPSPSMARTFFMEEGATLLNSSQHLAAKLDKQDASDELYTPIVGSFEGAAY